jgi:hypothetical protein
MTRPSRIVRNLSALAAALALLCTACGSGSPPPRLVTSRYETATGHRIVRDCGFSVPLPGQAHRSLWLFCDTLVTGRHGQEVGYPILGAGTAAEGPYVAGRGPGALTELATPAAVPPTVDAPGTPGVAGHGLLPARAAPQPFLPVPANLTLPASTVPCSTGSDTYPARWVTGAAREPGSSGHVLISYTDYCVSGGGTFTPEAFGLVDYDPAANALGPLAPVFTTQPGQQLPQPQAFGSPVFRGGYLYLFGWCGPGCYRGGVFLARTPAGAAGWDNGFTYQYWTGEGWSSDPARAAPLSGSREPLGVSVADYSADGHGLAMIEQTSAGGDFSLWQAPAPTGPWRQIQAGRVPCTAGKRTRAVDLCRALIGHPELSTRNELLISFFNPADGHVEVVPFGW